jgi:hypothetical protein
MGPPLNGSPNGNGAVNRQVRGELIAEPIVKQVPIPYIRTARAQSKR